MSTAEQPQDVPVEGVESDAGIDFSKKHPLEHTWRVLHS